MWYNFKRNRIYFVTLTTDFLGNTNHRLWESREMTEKIKDVAGKGKGLAAEFREFIMRGNVMDMAVGVIVGAAFKAIVDSLVADILMPLIGIFAGADDQSRQIPCHFFRMSRTAECDDRILFSASIQFVADYF